MAFASVGTFISQSQKTSNSTWNTTTEADVASGDLLIVVVAGDNIHTDDGETADILGVTYNGVAMTKHKEYTNGNAAPDTGAMGALFALKNAGATSSGAAVVVTFGSAIVAKAIRGWKFTMDNAKGFTLESSSTLSNDGNDMGSMELAGLVNREHLMFRASAVEDAPASHTATAGWTKIDAAADGGQTSGGAADSNMDAYGEFKIATSTAETSDPDADGVSPDCASVMCAFYEQNLNTGGDWPIIHRRRKRG
jgi:hypothetical protein